MRTSILTAVLGALSLIALVMPLSAQDADLSCAFVNPILLQGQDPSAVYHDGFYYLIQSDGLNLEIRKSAQLTELVSARPTQIYTLPSTGEYTAELWAPELVYLRGGWYVYFAADDGTNANHRMYALQADTADPLGAWTFKGRVYTDAATDKWAIDGAVFEYNEQLYMVWSGWPGDTGDFPQNLYLAPMSDPLTVGLRHLISEPEQPWERTVAAINEGPEPFIHDGQLSIVYSADASWTPEYKLGLLALTGDDPLDAKSWTKTGPVFQKLESDQGNIYGTGHNSMPVPSPDGTQSWLLFHANRLATDGWAQRQVYAQPFTWDEQGLPVFGKPIPPDVGIPVPSGQPCGEVARYPLDGSLAPSESGAPTGKPVGSVAWAEGRDGQALQLSGDEAYVDLTAPLLSTSGSFSVAVRVWLDRTDRSMTFVSQDGLNTNFALQYSVEAGNRLAFTTFTIRGKQAAQAAATFTPEANRWYQLVAVRDVLAQQTRLYVDGKLEATATSKDGWHSGFSTILGAAKVNHQRGQFLAGKLDDLVFYNGALSAARVAALFT